MSGVGVDRQWSLSTQRACTALDDIGELGASLGAYCTYRVGGPAAILIEVVNDAQIDRIAATVASTGAATLIVGNGSNLLVADRGFDGVVIHLGPSFATIDIADQSDEDGSIVVSLGGAALLPIAARATARAGLTGFEWAVGVPGSVGGAVRMNAGGHGADMSDSLVSVEVVCLASGVRSTRSVGELELGYRHSNLAANELVTRASIRLRPGNGGEEERLSEIVRWRRQHQPGGANAGSVFANPPGDSAGRLIDAAGLKGHRIGSASVSTKHANFIQVDSQGSADDVAALIIDLIARVERFANVELRPENRLIGFDPSTLRPDGTTTVDGA